MTGSRINITDVGGVKERADAVVSLAVRAAVGAHFAYDRMLADDGPAARRALGDLDARLAGVRREAGHLQSRIESLLGGGTTAPEPDDCAPSSPEAAGGASSDQLDRLVAETRRAGEITNARAQKLLGVDAAQARRLIHAMVTSGVVERAGRKLYRLNGAHER